MATITAMEIEKPHWELNLGIYLIEDSNYILKEILKSEKLGNNRYRIVLATMDSKIVEGVIVEKNDNFIIESRHAYQLVPL